MNIKFAESPVVAVVALLFGAFFVWKGMRSLVYIVQLKNKRQNNRARSVDDANLPTLLLILFGLVFIGAGVYSLLLRIAN